MNDPSPVYVARAIADAMADRARAAHRYLDEWAALAWAHVPVEHIRAVMDTRDVDETAPLAALSEWNGRRLWAGCGTVGTGKTFAAATWALGRVRAGYSVYWISAAAWSALDFDAQRKVENAATKADGLVLDDIGAGLTQGPGFRSRCEGMLLERAEKPSIVCGNLNKAECESWLDARLLSRMGREVVYFESRDRRPQLDEDAAEDCKACGGVCRYSARWHKAQRFTAELGVVDDERWDHGRSVLVKFKRVGHEVERLSGVNGLLDKLTARYKLDPAAVRDAAAKLETMTESLGAKLEASVRTLSRSMREDTRRRVDSCYGALHRKTPVGQPDPSTMVMAGKWPESGTDDKTPLRDLGFRVRSKGGRFEVRKMALDEHGKAKARHKGDIGVLMLEGDGNDRDGWAAARGLTTLCPPLPRASGDA